MEDDEEEDDEHGEEEGVEDVWLTHVVGVLDVWHIGGMEVGLEVGEGVLVISGVLEVVEERFCLCLVVVRGRIGVEVDMVLQCRG